jgi:hypothetical protein
MSYRDADGAPGVTNALPLVREAGAWRNLCWEQVAGSLAELLLPFDAAGDDTLMEWQTGVRLELTGVVEGAGAGDAKRGCEEGRRRKARQDI